MKTKPRKRDPDSKQRFCDPGACSCCQYIGAGDFLCDQHLVIVVADWQPTDDYMKCKKASAACNGKKQTKPR